MMMILVVSSSFFINRWLYHSRRLFLGKDVIGSMLACLQIPDTQHSDPYKLYHCCLDYDYVDLIVELFFY